LAPNVVEGPAVSLRSLTISLVTNLVRWKAENMSTKPTCPINNPKPETPRMRPAIKAGLRSFDEAEKAYMRQLGSVEIPTRVVILSGVWRALGAKRSRRTCGFSAKSDNIPCDKSRPVEGREHVNKAKLSHKQPEARNASNETRNQSGSQVLRRSRKGIYETACRVCLTQTIVYPLLKAIGFRLKGTDFSLKGTGLSLKGTGLSSKGTGFSPYIKTRKIKGL
jgi:hypothetical protein